MTDPTTLSPEPSATKNRIAMAIAAIAFGAGLMTMAAISTFYSSRLAVVHDAHRAEITTQEKRHSREKTKMHKQIVDKLDEIRNKVGGK